VIAGFLNFGCFKGIFEVFEQKSKVKTLKEQNMETLKKGVDEMYCSSCGAVIKKNVEICPNCGVKTKDGNGVAMASFILGIVSLVTGGWLLIPQTLGIIFGIMGLKSSKKGIAITGIVLSSLAFMFLIIMFPIVMGGYFNT